MLWTLSIIFETLVALSVQTFVKNTFVGKWCEKKSKAIAEWVNERYNVDIRNKEELKFRRKYPEAFRKFKELQRRLEELESQKDDQ